MLLSEQKYRDLGRALNDVYNDTQDDEDLFVGRAAVKEVWALVKPVLVKHITDTITTTDELNIAFTHVESQFLPDEATPEEKIGDVLRQFNITTADPDGFAAALLAVLKPEAVDEEA